MSRYSLCISNWNSANTVRRWADSLLKNLSDNDEVIIVDGLSSDGSKEFLEEFCDSHGFTFIAAKTNTGQARQLAFRSSHGEYVIHHLDTDDVIVSLREAKRLYHEVVEWDQPTGMHRAFRCWGFFVIPREMLDAVGGYSDLHFYEDQLLAYQLALRNQLTQSGDVSVSARGVDPKKRALPFRIRYSFLRVRDSLRLGEFDPRNVQGLLLLPFAWPASIPMKHYEFRRDWDKLDVHRDETILSWIEREHLSGKLLLRKLQETYATGIGY